MKGNLSPSIHEATIARHFKPGEDDPILASLFEGVKSCRESCAKANLTTDAVLQNEMETLPARHRKARAATFSLLENASKALVAAVNAAQAEVAAITTKLKGPAQSKDLITETRQRELRERLSILPEDRRKAIISEAVNGDDDLLVGAILSAPPWLSGLSDTDVALTRFNWGRRHHASDLDRLERIQKAIADSQRAGELALTFVDGLTDPELISAAEAQAKKAADALLAAKA